MPKDHEVPHPFVPKPQQPLYWEGLSHVKTLSTGIQQVYNQVLTKVIWDIGVLQSE